jgi:hypothetical protein
VMRSDGTSVVSMTLSIMHARGRARLQTLSLPHLTTKKTTWTEIKDEAKRLDNKITLVALRMYSRSE